MGWFKDILPKEIFWLDLRSKVKQMMKKVLEYSLNKELEAILQAEKYQHTQARKGYKMAIIQGLSLPIFVGQSMAF